jgi:hypothetical protein
MRAFAWSRSERPLWGGLRPWLVAAAALATAGLGPLGVVSWLGGPGGSGRGQVTTIAGDVTDRPTYGHGGPTDGRDGPTDFPALPAAPTSRSATGSATRSVTTGVATSGSPSTRGPARQVTPTSVGRAATRKVAKGRSYPVHDQVQTTWFNVGGVDDPQGGQETQNVASAWDDQWATHFGGCDGVGPLGPRCIPEQRVAGNGYFPRQMTPKENPFYVALPFDDANDDLAFARRTSIPWAADGAYAGRLGDRSISLMKNRWVAVSGPTGRACYAQVEDAGPWYYHDFAYVFSAAAPARRPSLDVSPSVFSCLGVSLDQGVTTTSWRFVDAPPPGPWTRVVTTRP